MKPDSEIMPEGDSVNSENQHVPSLTVNGSTDSLDFDIDDEVMGFMHSHIHKQLLKFTKRSAWGRKRGMMDQETKNYLDEVIRGSSLLGLMPNSESGFDDEDQENMAPAGASSQDNTSLDPEAQAQAIRTQQLSRFFLAKKVAEAFMANKPDKDTEQEVPSRTTNRGESSWDAPLMSARENALAPDDYK